MSAAHNYLNTDNCRFLALCLSDVAFIIVMNVKMPTIAGILTLVSRINTTSEKFKARSILLFQHLMFMSSRNLMLS